MSTKDNKKNNDAGNDIEVIAEILMPAHTVVDGNKLTWMNHYNGAQNRIELVGIPDGDKDVAKKIKVRRVSDKKDISTWIGTSGSKSGAIQAIGEKSFKILQTSWKHGDSSFKLFYGVLPIKFRIAGCVRTFESIFVKTKRSKGVQAASAMGKKVTKRKGTPKAKKKKKKAKRKVKAEMTSASKKERKYSDTEMALRQENAYLSEQNIQLKGDLATLLEVYKALEDKCKKLEKGGYLDLDKLSADETLSSESDSMEMLDECSVMHEGTTDVAGVVAFAPLERPRRAESIHDTFEDDSRFTTHGLSSSTSSPRCVGSFDTHNGRGPTFDLSCVDGAISNSELNALA
eukprot:g1079.t1